MSAQIRDLTHILYSYTDKNGHYCEVWGSDDVFDPFDTREYDDQYDVIT